MLTVNNAGHRAQALGLAEKIASFYGAKIIHHTVSSSAAAIFPPMLAAKMGFCKIGDTADIVIGCGAKSHASLLAMKRKFGAFAVCVERPRDEKHFDAVIAPRHDYSAAELQKIESDSAANTLPILGSAGGVCGRDLQNRRGRAREKFAHIPNPKTALLIGGDSRAYRISPAFCRELAESVRCADGGILATVSRRTGAENTAALKTALADGGGFLYCGEGENPYMDILAAADRFVVSADSVNMLSESAAAKKPLWFAEPPIRSARAAEKFRRFHSELMARDIARRWAGSFAEWTAPGLDETARAAAFVWRRYRAVRGG